MKYLKTFEGFGQNYGEPLNEEIIGFLWRKLKEQVKKRYKAWRQQVAATKGGKEVEEIFNQALKDASNQLTKLAGVQLVISSDQNLSDEKNKPSVEERYNFKMYEAEIAQQKIPKEAKETIEALKAKKALLLDTFNKIRDAAIKDMEDVLNKYRKQGDTNYPLEAMIRKNKLRFDQKWNEMLINYYSQVGDKTALGPIQQELERLKKEEDNIQVKKNEPMEKGDLVIYLLKGKTLQDWNKLSEKDKKLTTDGSLGPKAKLIAGIKKIEDKSPDGKVFTFKTNDGQKFTKNLTEILGKAGGTEKDVELKIGDLVKWTSKAGNEVEKNIEKIEGDNLFFTGSDGKEIKKNKSDVERVRQSQEE